VVGKSGLIDMSSIGGIQVRIERSAWQQHVGDDLRL